MTNVTPLNYNLEFDVDLSNSEFNGREVIGLTVEKETRTIVLNSADLKILECSLKFGKQVIRLSSSINVEKQELKLRSPKPIRGKAKLMIRFRGDLTDDLAGLYRSSYRGRDGKERYLATTQFEATDARRAFPCFDRPDMKATFEISIILDRGLKAISNTHVKVERVLDKKKKRVTFARTPKMSTYLLYIGVGPFEYLRDTSQGVEIRIATVPGKKNQGKLALQYTKDLLDYYQRYFKIKYPLKKLDLLAIPDFASGAMENWGAITFREIYLLYNKKTSSTLTKQILAEIIAHELAHQWFGNLVTMRWWNDLWLNESFATFMANKAVDDLYPGWDLQQQFLNSDTASAFRLDALKTSHSIDVKVNSPSEIAEIFDEISYAKGGSILRMVEGFVGNKAFRDGLRSYLTSNKYGNAETADLWSAIQNVSKKPVIDLMRTWIKQIGYPIVKTSVKDSKILFNQTRFMFEQSEEDKTKWHIPLSVRNRDRTESYLLTDREMIVETPSGRIGKVNYGQSGFYRVEYDDTTLGEFEDQIRTKSLSSVDRWGIQNDIFARCVAGRLSIDRYLEILGWYWDDHDYIVSKDIQDNLYSLFLLTSKERFWNKVKEYNISYLKNVFENIGWNPRKGEQHTVSLLRGTTILHLGRAGDNQTLRVASDKFKDYLEDPDSLNPDLRSPVYSLTAWQGSNETERILRKLFVETEEVEEKRRFLGALSGFKDVRILRSSLDYSLSTNVRRQDSIISLMIVAANPFGRDLVWPWIRENWGELSKRYKLTKTILGRVVDTLSVIGDKEKEGEIRDYFRKNASEGIAMSLEQAMERLRINSDFLENIRKAF
ncbi:MAG: M1 family metallopeptidase [Nitrososphaerales archaeon]